MYNDLFSIGSVTVHSYGACIAFGVLVALLVGDKRARNRGLNDEYVYTMTACTVILGFCCAKILFILTNFKDFMSDPKFYLTGNGFVVFGGIIGGIATIAGFCKIKKVKLIDYLDLMVPSVALAQGFGRIGCLMAGCCYGRETESAIGITFSHSNFAPNGVKLLPTQIMMSIGDFIIAGILFWYINYSDKKAMKESGSDKLPSNTGGRATVLYLITYSIGRFIIEFFRNDYRGNIGVLSTSQFIGILVALAATGVFFFVLPKFGQNKGE